VQGGFSVKFLLCFGYFVFISLGLFGVGRYIPKSWIRPDSLFFRLHAYEQNGKLYERMKLKNWQNKLPDMSKVWPWMPPKKMHDFRHRLPEMIHETCVAELTHRILPVLGLFAIRIWPEWGWLLSLLYAIGHQPFIWMQRYNRPKLMRVYKKLHNKSTREATQQGGKPIKCEL
jgi:glycosyl-4,4'-diaponeurosporenoate acyltransferase